MQKRHSDRIAYFKMQAEVCEKVIIPLLSPFIDINKKQKLLEIGCGEGGNLLPFVKRQWTCTGIDISSSRITDGKKIYETFNLNNAPHLIVGDVCDLQPNDTYDVIIARDVLEHLPCQNNFLKNIDRFLSDNGMIFINFPPWFSPFGGHQQICKNKILSHLPYIHLLPYHTYKKLLQLFGENEIIINDLLEIYDTRITTEKFKHTLKDSNLNIIWERYYIINPAFKIKFNMKSLKLFFPFNKIPFFRDFITTGYYVILKKKNQLAM
ncbi:MAG: class I SAM-dependent methyltransferase [Bacteroidales bacterium]|jgi:2-polyprenyl-3-methyl-5-hydroxy-6-metoxy-1,4-benzoquinol methylase|nr:class I SAM-dependent methyltransferase [Bacteroidales bacterium]MDI9575595.1 class I SAM-dependent methyltransferase [Bacteroidota bacterium]MDD3755872.1 class I SAM-dependent methyltransferase [Bacteroidales bacterium]MDY0400940.1 class I SAM-dependent methyltransferase [Bacteroidales bacterium]HHW59220.1 class I SAM-dependent methyltransferase [Bacteroidales bacterium]